MGNYQDECHLKEIHQLAEEFESCRKLLLALGDENRQHLILEMRCCAWASANACA